MTVVVSGLSGTRPRAEGAGDYRPRRKNFLLIKENIAENIYLYYKDEHIVSKYLWLFEFVKWIEKDESAKLKFKYMSEMINETNEK